MSPTQIFEPTYQAIKRLLMLGSWRAGHKLDTARLAERLGVSKSPIRDSLNRLAGERLVEFAPGEGFQVPVLDSRALVDLLDFNFVVLRATVSRGMGGLVADWSHQSTPAERAATLFRAMAVATGSQEMIRVVDMLNARLWPVRLLDARVLSMPLAALDALQEAIMARASARHMVSLLRGYHTERKAQAAAYVRLLGQERPPEPSSL